MTRYSLTGSLVVTARSTLHDVRASATALTGWLDAAATADEVDVSAAHLNLPVAALTSDNPLLTREIGRRLDARRHPWAGAEVAALVGPLGAVRPVRAELTLHGVRRSVDGTATVRGDADGTLRVDGTVTLDIRDFGLRPPSMLGLRVRPEVEVRLRLVGRLAN